MSHPFTAASAYIESLRHPGKKRYAKDYYQWIRAGRVGDSPEYSHLNISYMAAQAVRMSLSEILPEPITTQE